MRRYDCWRWRFSHLYLAWYRYPQMSTFIPLHPVTPQILFRSVIHLVRTFQFRLEHVGNHVFLSVKLELTAFGVVRKLTLRWSPQKGAIEIPACRFRWNDGPCGCPYLRLHLYFWQSYHCLPRCFGCASAGLAVMSFFM